MKYQETAVEIEKEIEKFNEAKRIHRFVILCLYHHVNLCRKSHCNNCKSFMEYRKNFLSNYNQKTSEEMISYFQQYCRQNYDDFYSLFLFLKSLAAIEKERLNLENKLKNMLEQWNPNTKI